MKIHFQPTSLYDTPLAQKDGRYRSWLMNFSFACERLIGVNPITDLRFTKQVRRWFLAGLSPYEAVKRRQTLLPRIGSIS